MDKPQGNSLKKQEDRVKSIIGKNLPQINKQYNTNLQLARFTDLKIVEDMKIIIEAGLDKDTNENQSVVFFINGVTQPTDKKLFEKFIYLFIKTLDPKIDNKMYTLVYFVGDEVISSGFTRFREFMKLLPVKYYIRMKQMFVFHASLFIRSFLFFENSRRLKLWRAKTTFIGDFDELFQVSYIHKRWVEFVPNIFTDGKDLTNVNNLRAESIALSPPIEKKPSKSIFGRELSSYELTVLGIPEVIDHLLSFFSRKPERFQIQGIFRKSGSVQEQMQLAQLLSEGHYEALRVINDVNIVADIIKKLFNSLTTPIINYQLYEIVVNTIQGTLYQSIFKQELKEEDQIEFISNIMNAMQQLHRRLLFVMLSFLLNIVQFEELNKMTTYNISVVFAPCFMWSQSNTTKEIFNIGLCIKFISIMLKNYKSIFPNITYTLFLQKPDMSASTSSHSSNGTESQLKQFEEEQKEGGHLQQLEKYQLESLEQKQNLQTIEQYELAKLEKVANMLSSQTSLQQRQTFNDEGSDSDLEFPIDSILTNVKENKPVELRKTGSQLYVSQRNNADSKLP